jgi:hypothetical protein
VVASGFKAISESILFASVSCVQANLGHGTVLTAACARQGRSATDYYYYHHYYYYYYYYYHHHHHVCVCKSDISRRELFLVCLM